MAGQGRAHQLMAVLPPAVPHGRWAAACGGDPGAQAPAAPPPCAAIPPSELPVVTSINIHGQRYNHTTIACTRRTCITKKTLNSTNNTTSN